MMKQPSQHLSGKILIIDDNPAEAEIITEAIAEASPHLQVEMVNSGKEALDLLQQPESGTGRFLPDLILLDLNMPGIDGRQLLMEVKQDQRLCHIPVIVVTTSDSENDIISAYRLHANCYVVKPLHFHEMMTLIQMLIHFWIQVAVIPGRQRRN